MKEGDGQKTLNIRKRTYDKMRGLYPSERFSCTDALEELMKAASKVNHAAVIIDEFQVFKLKFQQVHGSDSAEALMVAFSVLIELGKLKKKDKEAILTILNEVLGELYKDVGHYRGYETKGAKIMIVHDEQED